MCITEPNEKELHNFFETLASSGTKPAILSLINPFSNNYVPTSLSHNFPALLSELYDKDAVLLKVTVSKDEAGNVEESTAKSETWFHFRAGRITASKMKSVC